MKRTHRAPIDLRLKIAIIEARRTQRRVAVETRIGETRLSEIVGRRGSPPTDIERERIAKYLNRPEDDLFPATESDDQDDALASPDATRTA